MGVDWLEPINEVAVLGGLAGMFTVMLGWTFFTGQKGQHI